MVWLIEWVVSALYCQWNRATQKQLTSRPIRYSIDAILSVAMETGNVARPVNRGANTVTRLGGIVRLFTVAGRSGDLQDLESINVCDQRKSLSTLMSINGNIAYYVISPTLSRCSEMSMKSNMLLQWQYNPCIMVLSIIIITVAGRWFTGPGIDQLLWPTKMLIYINGSLY